jgi:phenylacetate-CoA ligase
MQIILQTGPRVGQLDPLFKGDLMICKAQIIKHCWSHIILRLVPGAGYDRSEADDIIERLRQRGGRVEVTVEHEHTIARSAKGKFKAVGSRVQPGCSG